MSDHSTGSKAWAQITQQPAWYIFTFVLWVLPATFFQAWPALERNRSFPEWLSTYGFTFKTLSIAWLILAVCTTGVMVWLSIRRLRSTPDAMETVQAEHPPLLKDPQIDKSLHGIHEQRAICPNLIFHRSSTVGAHEEGGQIMEGNDGRNLTFHAIAAEFNNRVDTEHITSPIRKVSATLKFTFFNEQKPIEITRGIWLSSGSKVDFDVNDTRRLLIATLEGDFEERHVYALDQSYSHSNPKRIRLSEPLLQVHVALIGESQSTILKQFDFS